MSFGEVFAFALCVSPLALVAAAVHVYFPGVDG